MTLARRTFLTYAALGSAATSLGVGAAERTVKGSGTARTERRDVAAFAGVALAGPFSVVLRPGPREAIEVVADDNLLPLIETRVRGTGADRSLTIGVVADNRIEPRTPIVVTVDYVQLRDLAVGGSGSLTTRGMKAGRLEAAIGGSGSIELAELDVERLSVAIGGSGAFRADGRARKLAVRVGGSGRCEADKLVADAVEVAVAGSGDSRVRAENALVATIAGSGNVFHTGAATPQVAIAGSGRVQRL